MLSAADRPILTVISQHAEESAHLRNVRSLLTKAPHVRLRDLGRIDDRIAAHLDGLAIAADFGWKLCEAAVEAPGTGEIFTAVVRAVEDRNSRGFDNLLALAEAAPALRPGLVSALGWVSAQFLEGTIKQLLSSSSPFRRFIAIACCAMHRVDPGKMLNMAVQDDHPVLRDRSLRAVAEIGRRDLLEACQQLMLSENLTSRFWATWSVALLSGRPDTARALLAFADKAGPFRERALQLALKSMLVKDGHAFLQVLAEDPKSFRTLIQGSGVAGDPNYVPWLIKLMENPKFARLAGESFSFITGLYLVQSFDAGHPQAAEAGPNDDPGDDNVAMDPEDGLPWPDPIKVQKWWEANKRHFQPGVRYFMGEPVNVASCKRVLREGYQRQRIAAALYLSLLQPGTPLFPTSVPAWRQQRWLAKMG